MVKLLIYIHTNRRKEGQFMEPSKTEFYRIEVKIVGRLEQNWNTFDDKKRFVDYDTGPECDRRSDPRNAVDFAKRRVTPIGLSVVVYTRWRHRAVSKFTDVHSHVARPEVENSSITRTLCIWHGQSRAHNPCDSFEIWIFSSLDAPGANPVYYLTSE